MCRYSNRNHVTWQNRSKSEGVLLYYLLETILIVRSVSAVNKLWLVWGQIFLYKVNTDFTPFHITMAQSETIVSDNAIIYRYNSFMLNPRYAYNITLT